MDQEERQRKVEAGRAKLAHFRQRKAKVDSANPQKKTQKRKGAPAVSEDPAPEECTIIPDMCTVSSRTPAEDSLKSGMDSISITAQQEQWPEAPEGSVLGDPEAAEACEGFEDLREMLVAHKGQEQLQELQMAVQKRNDIISQLSANLQVALQSRQQVQLEALQLSEQIRALQQQLQQASDYLLSHSHNCVEISEAHQHVSQFQHCLQGHASQLDGLHQQLEEAHKKTTEQQKVLTQKQAVMRDVHGCVYNLYKSQDAWSLREWEQEECEQMPSEHHGAESLLQRLVAELEKERERSQQEWERASQFEMLAQALKNEKNELKEQLACVQVDLNQNKMLASEGHQYKAEKEEVNLEMVRLKSLVQDLQNRLQQAEQTAGDLRAQFEADRSNYEFRLQTLEEEKEMDLAQLAEAHETALQRLKEDHKEKLQQLHEQLVHRQESKLSDIEDPVESFNSMVCENQWIQDITTDHQDPVFELSSNSGNHLMEKYLASTVQQDSPGAEDCLGELGQLEQVELNSELDIEKSRSPVQVLTEQDEDLSNGQSLVLAPWEGSPRLSQWPTCGSSHMGEEPGATEAGKALLTQECRDLLKQLEDKEKQLEVLQEEVQRSAEELQEAVQKWSCVTEMLQSVQWELEAERECRLHCEEMISRKTREEDNLRNRLSSLQSGAALLPQGIEDVLQELKQEKECLLQQLREQEQLVQDIQEQILAGDSVTCEVQVHFGHQLRVLQEQRDQLEAQLDAQRAKLWNTSELLGQKTLELDSAKAERHHLQEELLKSEDKVEKTNKENADLQSQLDCLQQNLVNVEEAVRQGAAEKAAQERRLTELEAKAVNMENVVASQQEEFHKQLMAKNSDVEKLEMERKNMEVEHQEKVCALEKELGDLRSSLMFQENEHRKAAELLQKESKNLHKAVDEAEAQLTSCQQANHHLEQKHQEVVQALHLEMQRKLMELKDTMEEEQKRQIVLIKQLQVHEREHQREQAEVASRHQEQLACLRLELTEELRDGLETAHQAELLQVQAQQALELEALRLSLSEQHAAQLELSQQNLQRDKEAALSELQTSLRDRWAQENAMLQTRQQRELERVREQHQQELDKLKEVCETRLLQQRVLMEEQQASELEAQRAALHREANEARTELQALVSNTQGKLEDLLTSQDQKVRQLEEDLTQAWLDRDAAARAVEELVSSHKVVLEEHKEHVFHLEEQLRIGAEKEQQLEQQLEKVKAECLELKSSSKQEVTQLWSQLESMRASRQELGELKDQLLARSSCVEDIERLKQEFSQQRKNIQEHNELELENLRSYFEQRLRATEESYREEIALLQLKLVEGALEESVLKTGDASFVSEGSEEKSNLMAEVTAKLEKHKEDLEALRLQLEGRHKQDLKQLRASLATAYQEELLQVKADLADCHFQEMKSKHALELEQLRAKLSESHLKEITRLRLQNTQDVAQQVEAELKQKAQALVKEYQAQLTKVCLQGLEKRHITLAEERDGELKRSFVEERTEPELQVIQPKDVLKGSEEYCIDTREELQADCTEQEQEVCQQHSLHGKESPHVARQAVEAQFHSELHVTKSTVAYAVKELDILLQEHVKARLHDTQDRFRKQQRAIEKLAPCHEEMGTFRVELEQLEVALNAAHRVELEQLEANLNAAHRVELEQLEVNQKKQRDDLESQMLSNMDILEATYLSEIQTIRSEHMQLMQEKERSHSAELQRLSEKQQRYVQAATEELRGKLAQAHVDKFTAMAAELGQAHKEELLAALSSQRQSLEDEHEGALAALRQEVLSLEEQHSNALHELQQLHLAEVETLQERQQQRLQELSSASARELEALCKELEEVCHQRSALQKEVELLRRQCEEQQTSQGHCESQQELSETCTQLQEREAGLLQLHAEMSQLKAELEGKRSEMATLEGLLQRRERENQEGSNLVAMLRADLSSAAEDRKCLQEGHDRLLRVLVEVLKTTLATEDLINRQIGVCLDKGPSADLPAKDDGMEMSHRLSESLLHGLDLEPEGEDVVLRACGRLRSAVDKLLDLLSESTKQLQDTQGFQAVLQEQFTQGRNDTAQLVLQQQRLLEQLDLEASVKSQLELELHKAEGLMEGYVAEKAALEEAVQQKENQEQRLVEELEALRVKLQELSEERTLLLRQRDSVSGTLGDIEKALLEEVQRLGQEKLDVQRQAEKDHSGLVSRLKLLESELEQQVCRGPELEERHRTRCEDLQQHIHALEKQLKHNRQFIDEQAVEREHERDEFQQEIKKLEAQLRQPNKGHSTAESNMQRIDDLVQQVESLQAAMKEKVEDYNTLLQTKEQFEHNVAEQNEEIDRMASRIQELEEALRSSTETNRALSQLEQELQKARKVEQDLLRDREALQQQQYSNRMHISALQSKLDETRHRVPDSSSNPALREQLTSLKQDLLDKEKQVEVLLEQLEEVQRNLGMKEEKALQLNLQLDELTRQNATCVTQMQNEIGSLKEQLSSLQKFQDVARKEVTAACSLQLPFALIEEKNLEIDHLNQQILQLQQELSVSKDCKVEQQKQAEVEHLRSQVELLRQTHEEETEQLHEVIDKLQEELVRLGPDRMEVSDPVEQSSPPSGRWPPASREDSLGRELQRRLDLAHSERDALQQLLRNQEDSFRSQREEMEQSLEDQQQHLNRMQEEAANLTAQLSQEQRQAEQLSTRLQELEAERDEALAVSGRAEEQLRSEFAAVEAIVAQLRDSQAQIGQLETLKESLSGETHILRQSKACLQEEVERLKREVASNSAHIQQLNQQLEDQEAECVEAHKEVLKCADETLAKAEEVLQEKEQQLAQLIAEHSALRAELASVKEGLSSSTERAEKLVEEGQTKDQALAELEVVNQHLKLELCRLQEDLALQEEELCSQHQELEQLREQHGLQVQQDTQPLRLSLSQEAFGGSPEHLRHLDISMDQMAHLSELSALHCTSLELHTKDRSLLPEILPSSMDLPSVCSPGSDPSSTLASDHLAVNGSSGAGKVKELENMDLMPPSSLTCSTTSPSPHDWASDGYGSNVSLELGAQLQVELDAAERLDAHFLDYLRQRGMAPADSMDSVAVNEELLSPELQSLLKKLYHEACHILALSQPLTASTAPPSWQREKRALQEAVVSLRELLCKVANHKPQVDNKEVDWSANLLQSLHRLFASERDWLRSELQSVVRSHPTLDPESFMKQLADLLKQQEGHQRQSLEQLLSAERRCLLAQLQDLQGQMRISSLKSQEQLQQLRVCMTTTQEESSQHQHQLRRQVELLEFQLQQEQTLMQDLRSSLAVEQDTVALLKKELEESSLQLSAAGRSQQELHNEICGLRVRLESEETECLARDQEMRQEKEKLHELQQEVDHKQAQVRELQEEVQRYRLQQEEQQHSHKVLQQFLEQEHVANSNLRRELQIEQSRCEALIVQERQRTNEVTQQLEEAQSSCDHLRQTLVKEKQELEMKLQEALSHSAQLMDALVKEKQELEMKLQEALSHSAQLTDALVKEKQELMKRLDEARRQNKTALHDRRVIQELRNQLEQEHLQREKVVAMLSHQQQEMLHSKQKVEQELHSVQEQLRSMQEKNAQEKLRETCTWQEKLLELDQQHQQDLQHIHQLQQSLADLQQSRPQGEPSVLHNQHQLTIAQLQLAIARMKDILHRASSAGEFVRGSIGLVQMEEDLRLLLHILCDLEQDLKVLSQASPSSAALERLAGENAELRSRIAALSQDKATLQHSLSCLRRDLQTQPVGEKEADAMLLGERLSWQKERAALQAALRKAEAQLSQATAEVENRPLADNSSSKVQRLYKRYLRAESFRKALVYQKKYLLLLLGGFQDCETATLSLIARMGVHPSPADLQAAVPRSRPINRFRAAVRVVIAVSRLQFLVRKWQKAARKGTMVTAGPSSQGFSARESYGHTRSSSQCEVLRQQHPGALFNSPAQGVVSPLVPPMKSSLSLQSRLYPSMFLYTPERPHPASQDPEHSLSEYIHHLEAVQQRLGTAQKARSSHVEPPESGACSHVMHATDMLRYDQKWLLGNRTRLYLSRLSPLYRCVPGEWEAVLTRSPVSHQVKPRDVAKGLSRPQCDRGLSVFQGPPLPLRSWRRSGRRTFSSRLAPTARRPSVL
ncbi:pericentrin isoform X2 [Scleropages formosus]|uniref:pericentrin isoform X2 n=1 Tax=Scleropages formosus TaxID=113540 RepID=UPI0010FA6E17|nr:pericentrin isoform X2 [Scleropages formosus]